MGDGGAPPPRRPLEAFLARKLRACRIVLVAVMTAISQAVRSFSSRHPEVSFLALTLLFSWSIWLPVILSQRGVISVSIPPNPLGSFGPAFAAIVISWLGGNRAGDVVSRFRSLGSTRWFAFGVIVLPIAMFAISALALSVIHSEPLHPRNLDQWVHLAWLAPVILILGGPLGEETGWRGFLLPRLESRFTPVTSSLLVAGAWLLWHLPLFWMEGAAQQGASIGLFAVMVVWFSLLFTWVFNRSKGSLWPVILFHTSINTVSVVFPTVFPEVAESKSHDHLLLMVVCLVALMITASTRGALGKLGHD